MNRQKGILVGVLLGMVLWTTHAVAQTYELRVLNPTVIGTNLEFDVYLKRTGGTSVYLGNADFVLTFNNAFFTNPTAEVVTEGLSGSYGFSASIVSVNRCVMNVLQPTFSNQSQFDARVTDISASDNGSLIGRFRVTGISNPTGTAGFLWRDVTPNQTLVTTLAPTTPWNGTNITNPAGHIPPPSPIPLPVQLSRFTATVVNGNSVRLDWTTISELNNYGFYVERRRSNDSSFTEIPNSFVPGHGTTNEPHHYTFTDQSPGAPIVWYRLRQVDLDGTPHYTEPIQASGLTSVQEKELAPIEFALKQNYPNPFNPSTEIKFSVETLERTVLEVFNVIGQRLATLFDDVAEPGQYYKVRFNASNLASGIYLYRLQNGSKSASRKILLLK